MQNSKEFNRSKVNHPVVSLVIEGQAIPKALLPF
jgi:hypothetical protein